MNKIEAPTKFGIGNALTRFEDGRFLTGRGRYVDDLRPEGCLDAVFLRSPVAHARLISVSADEARAMPGVVAVLTDADLAADGLTDVPLRTKIPFIDGRPMAEPRRPLLARDKLVYVGQPVAMVIAESRAAAIDARDAIELDWEELPAVTDPAAALAEGAEQIHPEAPGNLAFDWEIGDEAAADAALAGAVRRVSLPIVNNRIAVVPMEPRGVLSWMDQETGMLHIEGALQQVFAFKNFISSALGMEAEKVHVSAPDVGGGFGGKNQVQADYVLTAHAARRLGRPVKWIDDRSDAFVADTQARSVLSDVTLGFDAEGRITGLRIDSVADLGANVSTNGALIPTSAAAAVLGGTYKVPAIYMKVRATFTNTTPVDAYRGAGRPEVIFLIERAMDKAAAEFGLTPVEIRRRNFIPASAMPYDTPIGRTIDVGDFEGVMDKALAAAGWDGFAARKADSATRGLKRGFGLVSYLECTLGPPVETADIVVSGDGRVELALGTQSNGQGHETTFAQILADKLDVDIDRIGFTQADTARIPVGGGHGGSRSTQLGGTALVKTVEVVVEKGRLIAADRLEAAAEDIEYSGGSFRIAGTDRSMTLFEVAAAAEGGQLDGQVTYEREAFSYPNGCHVAEVEVDPETGVVDLVSYTAVDDFGNLINPLVVSGQGHGGIAQGVGQALFEHVVFDPETGQPLSASFMDYTAPRADRLPDFDVQFHLDCPSPSNPLGVKGCGESGCTAAPPAIVSAVCDALAEFGVSHIEMPLTPLRVWQAIVAAKGG